MQNLEKKSPTGIGQFKQSDNTITQSNNSFDNNSNDILTLEDNYCTKNTQESWLNNTVQMAIEQVHRPIPMVKDEKGIHPIAYGANQRYEADNPIWDDCLQDIVAVALDDFILVDYDGNKPKGAIHLAELFAILRDEPKLVQQNDKADSLHYLYRIPAHIDKHTLKHSNDNWLHGVDIKTMNQLMYLKQRKTIIDSELPTLEEVEDAPQAIIDALTKVTSENLKARSESKAGKLKAAEIISHIDPDCEYNEWRNVGMGLHNEFKGDPLGLQIWDNWSATGSSYSGFTGIEYKYKSFTGDKGITFGTVCKMAKDNGADLSEIAKKYNDVFPKYTKKIENVTTVKDDFFDFDKFSLNGDSATMKAQMLSDAYVLGKLAILGQLTAFYAKPNSGKTLLTLYLLIEAIKKGDIKSEDVYYINADDNYKGLVQKLELAEKYGFQMLAPNFNNFNPDDFSSYLHSLIQSDAAKGKVIILDTLKKFTNIMDKKLSSDFGRHMRSFVTKGGTIIMLAHTNKNRDGDGKVVFSGTSDIVDDVDCAYTLDITDDKSASLNKTVLFENIKSRGDVEQEAAYKYLAKASNYEELLDSVSPIDETDAILAKERIRMGKLLDKNEKTIDVIRKIIEGGTTLKTELINKAIVESKESKAKVCKALEDHTGKKFIDGHRWEECKGQKSAKMYKVINAPDSKVDVVME
jgi:hypothetical protein